MRPQSFRIRAIMTLGVPVRHPKHRQRTVTISLVGYQVTKQTASLVLGSGCEIEPIRRPGRSA